MVPEHYVPEPLNLTKDDPLTHKMKLSAWMRSLAIWAVMAVAGGPALASPPPGQAPFNITATVAGSCTLSAADASLGAYDSSTDLDGTAEITYQCTSGLSPSISLGAPFHTLSTGTGGNIDYNLYQDSGHSVLWGDGVTNGSQTEGVTADGSSHNATAYIRVYAGQGGSAWAGSYSDTVTATINW
jgi:spore coat protein U-like protein